jgi:hypothetical protein
MTKEELNQLITVGDLQNFRKNLVADLEILLKLKNRKEFYSPKEFSYKTGMKYSTVIYRCKMGKLKARQDDPNCSWSIYSSEIERFIQEANENQ